MGWMAGERPLGFIAERQYQRQQSGALWGKGALSAFGGFGADRCAIALLDGHGRVMR